MTDNSDDETARTILRTAGPLDRPAPVTDALIAAWAEGRLDPERAALVEAHLAADDEARGFALALREELLGATKTEPASDGMGRAGSTVAAIPSLASARARRATWTPFAAAAAVLVALGAAFLASKPTPPTGESSDALLVAAASTLAAESPVLFADFRPVGAAERREAVDDATRSGLAILSPIGHVFSPRPALRWVSTAGASSYEVVVADADGRAVWRTTTDRTSVAPEASPRLDKGRSYLIEVSAAGPLGRTTASRTFDIADEVTGGVLNEGRSRLLRKYSGEFGSLAFAHWAARHGFLTDAKVALAIWLEAHGDDLEAREFDEYLRRRLGWPESASSKASSPDRR